MISAREAEKIAGRKLDSKFKISYPIEREVVLFPEKADIQPFFNRDYCYVLVHTGSSYYMKNPNLFKNPYGDYSSYVDNVGRLIRDLESSQEPSLFVVELEKFKKHYPKEFLPPERSLMIYTKAARPGLVDSIEVGKLKRRINLEQNRILPYLKNNGVKELRMAGEWTWHDMGLGCVRFVAREFEKAGFEIKGVKSCLFPSAPPEPPFMPEEKEYESVTRKIFENQVEFTS